MLTKKTSNFLSLPELEFTNDSNQYKNTLRFYCKKTSDMEVCPKCATPSITKYDKRVVIIKDQPIRDRRVYLHITKRRFYCKACKKPFTEPVQGIVKGSRTTSRFKRHVLWCATNFADL